MSKKSQTTEQKAAEIISRIIELLASGDSSSSEQAWLRRQLKHLAETGN